MYFFFVINVISGNKESANIFLTLTLNLKIKIEN